MEAERKRGFKTQLVETISSFTLTNSRLGIEYLTQMLTAGHRWLLKLKLIKMIGNIHIWLLSPTHHISRVPRAMSSVATKVDIAGRKDIFTMAGRSFAWH